MTAQKYDRTVLVTVASIQERDALVRKIYKNLTKEPTAQFTIQQDQINRIKVFHNAGRGVRVLIRTYLVIVLPIIMDMKLLNCATGLVEFHLEETVKQLQSMISKLQTLQGTRYVKGAIDGKAFEQLVRSLSAPDGKY